MKTLSERAADLESGDASSRGLVEQALEAIAADPRAFTAVYPEAARKAADACDAARRAGRVLSPYAGIPISVKDLFDLEGETTLAGAAIRRGAPPARRDARIVERLRGAGVIIVGKTQMSEFAFTGLGLNPHAPQPVNPVDPLRAPGGSSGGAGVCVALGQVPGAIGTDTGGSVRIPAAWCGLVGFKPTQARISRDGAFPLSETLDSIGPLARTVEDCRILDGIMANDWEEGASPPPKSPSEITLGIPDRLVLDDLAPEVASGWERGLSRLSAAGVRLTPFAFPELSRLAEVNARGTISNAEAYAMHRRLGLLERREAYDPQVLVRIEVGARMSAADYLDLLAARSDLIAASAHRTAPFDAIIAPTTPNLPPRLTELETPEVFVRQNALALRNASIANFLDRCAISLPLATDCAPSGFMMIGENGRDRPLLDLAQEISNLLV
ncbi:MAG: amidase [Alphaproteobacteria bacterium]|nr:amidase [Alphaproteobacteria bacterium]